MSAHNHTRYTAQKGYAGARAARPTPSGPVNKCGCCGCRAAWGMRRAAHSANWHGEQHVEIGSTRLDRIKLSPSTCAPPKSRDHPRSAELDELLEEL